MNDVLLGDVFIRNSYSFSYYLMSNSYCIKCKHSVASHHLMMTLMICLWPERNEQRTKYTHCIYRYLCVWVCVWVIDRQKAASSFHDEDVKNF